MDALISTFEEHHVLGCCFGLSAAAAVVTYLVIPSFFSALINAGLSGKDLGKRDRPVIPEAVGVICGMAYLVSMTVFIPIEFDVISNDLVSYLGGLLAICWMVLLGFLDDVLNLKWRHKLWIPTVASLPLLVVYMMYIQRTIVVLPRLPFISGMLPATVDLGLIFYVYMGMLAVFCTNSINIYAGINGLEVGQSLVIAMSIIIFNIIELNDPVYTSYMHLSLHFMIPFTLISFTLYRYNSYPARVFVGDTYCYFAGMTFAVVGILAHMSKTLLLFFLPQIFNFLFSVPQLFKVIPCPRHRLPKFNPETGLLENSWTDKFRATRFPRNIIVKLLSTFNLIKVKPAGDEGDIVTTNFTMINLALVWLGPMHEKSLTNVLLALQIVGTGIAFFIRYAVAHYFYG